jgi:hypothetical protein
MRTRIEYPPGHVPPNSVPKYFIGLDLGQAQDPTAVCIVERKGDIKTGVCHVPQLKRYALGTSYNAIVDDLAEKLKKAPQGTRLILDGTGVGRAVVDMITGHEKLRQTGVQITAVTITAGNDEARDGIWWRVPKRNLVGAVQVLLQSQRLKIAENLSDTPALVSELQNFKVKITDSGNDVYGEWRSGKHDDLVLAVALGAWAATNPALNQTGQAKVGGVKQGLIDAAAHIKRFG